MHLHTHMNALIVHICMYTRPAAITVTNKIRTNKLVQKQQDIMCVSVKIVFRTTHQQQQQNANVLTFTRFSKINPQWRKNCCEERQENACRE